MFNRPTAESNDFVDRRLGAMHPVSVSGRWRWVNNPAYGHFRLRMRHERRDSVTGTLRDTHTRVIPSARSGRGICFPNPHHETNPLAPRVL
jgi:hypothetical protein